MSEVEKVVPSPKSLPARIRMREEAGKQILTGNRVASGKNQELPSLHLILALTCCATSVKSIFPLWVCFCLSDTRKVMPVNMGRLRQL